MVLGGLRESARLARAARAGGYRLIVTTTFEGPVGTAAALHLAAVVGDVELASGLASADVVEASFPDSLIPRRGELRGPRGAGLGVGPGTGGAE
jgi:muconate cycloisomerase